MYRVAASVAGLLVLGFGFVYHLSGRPVVDPLWSRALIAAPAFAAVALSFSSTWVRHHLAGVVQGYFCLLIVWFIVVMSLNGGSPDYAVGLMYVIFGTGSAFMLMTTSLVRLAALVGFAATATGTALLLPIEIAISPVLMVACVTGLGLVVLLVGYLRHVDTRAMRRSEEHLAEAQRIAGLGNWQWDLRADEAYWSEEAARLVGWPAGRDLSLRGVLECAAPDDRSKVMRYVAALHAGKAPPDTEFRVLRAHGRHAVVRVRGRRECDGRGRPVRLVGTIQDVTEQKRREAELVQAKEAAEEMVRLKDAFLTNMSHEVRTPLAGIIGYAQVLAEEVPEEQHDFLRSIEQSGRRLLDTLNTVLDLARLEAGDLDVEREPVVVAAVAQSVADAMQPLAREKEVVLSLDAGADLRVLADASMLHRTLYNLVGNAVKFTEQGHVAILAEHEEGEVVLRVVDTGIGIAPEFMSDLFREFSQGSDGLARSHEGIGLGLTITKRLVDLMGGTIEVESEPGCGTTFTIRMPSADGTRVPAKGGAAAEEAAVRVRGHDGA